MENFDSVIKEKDDNDLIRLNKIFKDEIKEIEEKVKKIKKEFAERMHKRKINELIINCDNVDWKIAYQSTKRKKIDYDTLYEIVGPHKYPEIVKENVSTFLIIKKAPKKKNSKLKTKPVEDDIFQVPPTGNLA